ncbi:MAG TPA: DUF2997 domain-containing protein [Verrucomicrobiae bacterium]|nr:DUF2997 domain-containing protein [Verrucomicrobiae bacterium]
MGNTGEIQIDAVGFKGPDCEQATKFLEEALGVVAETKKPNITSTATGWASRAFGDRPCWSSAFESGRAVVASHSRPSRRVAKPRLEAILKSQ